MPDNTEKNWHNVLSYAWIDGFIAAYESKRPSSVEQVQKMADDYATGVIVGGKFMAQKEVTIPEDFSIKLKDT